MSQVLSKPTQGSFSVLHRIFSVIDILACEINAELIQVKEISKGKRKTKNNISRTVEVVKKVISIKK